MRLIERDFSAHDYTVNYTFTVETDTLCHPDQTFGQLQYLIGGEDFYVTKNGEDVTNYVKNALPDLYEEIEYKVQVEIEKYIDDL